MIGIKLGLICKPYLIILEIELGIAFSILFMCETIIRTEILKKTKTKNKLKLTTSSNLGYYDLNQNQV
jgi:hypothetical protein